MFGPSLGALSGSSWDSMNSTDTPTATAPPANQLVFVTTSTPYEGKGLFEAVNVTGMFGTASISTQLADIAYALSADKMVPYRT